MTDAELWEALTRLADEPADDMTSEEVDAELRAIGIDPDALVNDMNALLREETDR